MISKEAVEAFKRFYRDRGVYLNHGLDCHLSDALSAALPVLLEGKREEIARVIEPWAFSDVEGAIDWCRIHRPERDGWELLAFCHNSLGLVQAAFDRADRIIAMLGGGE